jgi:hypothetical protein
MLFRFALSTICLLLLVSCYANTTPERSSTPNYSPNQNQYYYPPQGYQAPQYQQPYSPPYPYQQQYNPYGNTGGSRFYSNPYAIPQSQYAPYDSDQYYVPPSSYNGREVNQKANPFYRESSAFQNF